MTKPSAFTIILALVVVATAAIVLLALIRLSPGETTPVDGLPQFITTLL
jgi:hypothetical protein